MVLYLTPVFSTIFSGYILTVPIARMAMYECTPTLFAAVMVVISAFLTTCLYVPTILEHMFRSTDAVSVVFTVLTFILAIFTYIVEIRGPAPAFVDMRGKTILVTGANSGIGLETARQQMLMGATVVLGCRSPNRAQAALDDLLTSLHKRQQELYGHDTVESRCVHVGNALLQDTSLDLSSLESVRKYVSAYSAAGLSLDVLVCNAGMIPARFEIIDMKLSNGTSVPVESAFAANHLGHHLLIKLCQPLLRSSFERRSKEIPTDQLAWSSNAPSRIVVVSSSLHKAASGAKACIMHTDPKTWSSFPVYGNTKLANLLGMHRLIKELAGSTEYSSCINVNALHPGNPVTSVTGNLPAAVQALEKIFYPFMFLYRETCHAGAFCSVWTASNKNAINLQNQYYIDSAPAVKNKDSENDEYSDRLWDLCESLCK